MARINTFRDLKVWQKAHLLVLSIYKVTEKIPREEKFGLIIQMRRAAISVAANIVEGFKRKTIKDSLSFYNIAESSLEELKYQLLIVKDLKYISGANYNNCSDKCDEVGKLLYAWIVSQKRNLK